MRFVVRVVRRRATRIDVRCVADACATLADSRDDDRELRQESQNGGSSSKQWTSLWSALGSAHSHLRYAGKANDARERPTVRGPCKDRLSN